MNTLPLAEEIWVDQGKGGQTMFMKMEQDWTDLYPVAIIDATIMRTAEVFKPPLYLVCSYGIAGICSAGFIE
jgi:hypothetical protein